MTQTKQIALIGAGQIGSRHLQALAKINVPAQIYVIDPSTESLETAQSRAEEISPNQNITQIQYLNSLNEVPQKIDLCIIATSANIRLSIIKELFAKNPPPYLILEKVLFQNTEDFLEAQKIFKQHQTKVWVNCPLRLNQFYRDLKKRFNLTNKPIHYQYKGGEWIGLACNSIHYLDHITFLTDSSIETVECDEIDKEIHQSKRAGFIEMTGTLKAKLKNGSDIKITSIKDSEQKSSINITSSEFELTIDELSGEGTLTNTQTQTSEKITAPIEYQSNLTHKICEDIFKTDTCKLTPYTESMETHLPFIKALTTFVTKVTNQPTNQLPIT